ncbi:MAG: ClC family H(+)/Cl(-) exchange transporter [Burkholderiaceae bacterium]|nr:ClC family H(+)/Cl(-) exchange transporter [Burkholderiaceae bacterium]
MKTSPPKLEDEPSESSTRGLTQLLLVSAFAGALVGLVGGSFHWLLTHGSHGFAMLVAQWKAEGFLGLPGWLLTMLVVGLCVAIARWLVTFAPSAAGSGVQHVEAVMREEATPASFRVLPIKFLGGLLAMVPGLALGREGPTIQMAAVIGTQCGKWFGFTRGDRTLLYTAIAGSGLSVAFNAPLSGVAFVIEEVAHRITMRRLLATLIAVATAIAIYRSFFGNAVELSFTKLIPSSMTELVAYGLLGAWLGALGVMYNKSVLMGLNVFQNTAPKVSPIIKAGILGALIGLVAYWQPQWVGGGEIQVNAVLAGQLSINALLILFLVRWVLGSLSYSMGVPGGLFAPLLLVGATSGALFATSINFLVTAPFVLDPISFALVGMAAFFTAVVRAPFTGILLIIEMSGSVALVAPLIVASVAACLVASLMHGEPIYDSLRARMPQRPTDH